MQLLLCLADRLCISVELVRIGLVFGSFAPYYGYQFMFCSLKRDGLAGKKAATRDQKPLKRYQCWVLSQWVTTVRYTGPVRRYWLL